MHPTPDILKRMVAMLEAGNMPTVAAAALHIPKDTFANWMRYGLNGRDGRPPEEPYATFAAECRAAKARGNIYILGRCREFGMGYYMKAPKNGDGKPVRYASKMSKDQAEMWKFLLGKSPEWTGDGPMREAEVMNPMGEIERPNIYVITGEDPDSPAPQYPDAINDEFGKTRSDLDLEADPDTCGLVDDK